MGKYSLTIKPAIPPKDRHMLEDTLKAIGYLVWAGGQDVDGTECDISFDEGGERNVKAKE